MFSRRTSARDEPTIRCYAIELQLTHTVVVTDPRDVFASGPPHSGEAQGVADTAAEYGATKAEDKTCDSSFSFLP
jgi:hypothetical protein